MEFEKSLKHGKLGWPQVAGLGIAIVIAGQFSGWNLGLSTGGWGGMAGSMILVALMYFGLTQSIAEMASAMPSAGGFQTYSSAAFGPLAGFVSGLSVFVALTVGAALVPEFLSQYSQSVFGIGGWWFKMALFLFVIGVHIRGVGEAVGLTLVTGAIAVAVILVFGVLMLPHFETANLYSQAPDGGRSLFPNRVAGVFACIPFAVWLLLAVENTALAAEEARDPARTMPRGILVAIGTLILTALIVLVLAPGGAGVGVVGAAGDPLYAALAAKGTSGSAIWIARLIGIGAIAGLFATFFSLVYSASRLLFALARSGELPRILARTNRRGSPWVALLLIGLAGVLLSGMPPARILLLVVLLLNINYVLTLSAFLRLRRLRADSPAPYRAIGGAPMAVLSLVLALVVIASCLQLDAWTLSMLGGFYLIAIGAFAVHARARRLSPAA